MSKAKLKLASKNCLKDWQVLFWKSVSSSINGQICPSIVSLGFSDRLRVMKMFTKSFVDKVCVYENIRICL